MLETGKFHASHWPVRAGIQKKRKPNRLSAENNVHIKLWERSGRKSVSSRDILLMWPSLWGDQGLVCGWKHRSVTSHLKPGGPDVCQNFSEFEKVICSYLPQTVQHFCCEICLFTQIRVSPPRHFWHLCQMILSYGVCLVHRRVLGRSLASTLLAVAPLHCDSLRSLQILQCRGGSGEDKVTVVESHCGYQTL